MVCARPWKTCNCPWFSYDHLSDEGTRGLNPNDMRIPALAEQDVIEVIEEPPSPPVPAPTSPAVLTRRTSTRARQRSSRERDRSLERADEALAAHLQAQLNLESSQNHSHSHSHSDARRSDRRSDRDPAVQVYGVGNAGTGHHMNDSYTVRPLVVSTSTSHRVPPPPTSTRRNTLSNSIPSIFTPIRHLSHSFTNPNPAVPAPPPAVKPEVNNVHANANVNGKPVRSSTMAGLSRDGSKRGAGRVGTWLNHVTTDFEAVATAPRGVECDVWEVRGGVVGID